MGCGSNGSSNLVPQRYVKAAVALSPYLSDRASPHR